MAVCANTTGHSNKVASSSEACKLPILSIPMHWDDNGHERDDVGGSDDGHYVKNVATRKQTGQPVFGFL